MAFIVHNSRGRALASATSTGIALALDPAQASFDRQGNSLVISTEDGSLTEIVDFFVFMEGGLPDVVLPGGERISGSAFLLAANAGLDLSSAAGPSYAGGGGGDYDDSAGALLDGVDTLGSLSGGEKWGNGPGAEAAAPALFPVAAVEGDAGAVAGRSGPDGPTGGGEPVGIGYHARAVLYPGSDADAREHALHVAITDKDGLPLAGVNPDQVGLEVLLPEGAETYFAVAGVGADGQVALRLTQAGLDALAGGRPVFNYLRVIAGGNEYTVQLTASADGSFNSQEADADKDSGGYLAGGRLLYGEHHEGPGLEAPAGRSNLIDAGAYGGVIAFHDGGMAASGAGGSNRIALHTAENAAATVSLASSAQKAAMSAETGGSNSIDGSDAAGAVDVFLVQNNSAGTAVMYASGTDSANSIRHAGSVSLAGSIKGEASAALWAGDGGTNSIEHIRADLTLNKGDAAWTGMTAEKAGRNVVKEVGGNVEVVGKTYGVYASMDNASNTISGVGGNVEITGENCAMYAAYARNAISNVDGDVTVMTGTRAAGTGVYAKGSNGISIFEHIGGNLTVVNTGEAAAGAGLRADFSGSNIVNSIGGNVEIAGGGGYGLFAQISGRNTISGVEGDVDISGGYGLHALSKGGNAISGVGGGLTVAGRTRALSAEGEGSFNTIEAGDAAAIEVRIFVPAGQGRQTYALYAKGGVNTIRGSDGGADHISITGDVYAADGGKNIISTGTGKSIIDLDGSLKSADSLTIETCGGYDVLVLRAGSAGEFTARYQAWLEQLSDSGVEIAAVKVLAGAGSGASLADLELDWLEALFPGKAESMTLDEYQDYRDAFFAPEASDEGASSGEPEASGAYASDAEQDASAPAVQAGTQLLFDAGTIEHLREMNFSDGGTPGVQESGAAFDLGGMRDAGGLYLSLDTGRADAAGADLPGGPFDGAGGNEVPLPTANGSDGIDRVDDSGQRAGGETSGADAAGTAAAGAAYQHADDSELLALYIQQTAGG